MSLSHILNRQLRKSMLLVWILIALSYLASAIFFYNKITTDKQELTNYISNYLNFEAVTPSDEARFLKSLKNATGDFSFKLNIPNPN